MSQAIKSSANGLAYLLWLRLRWVLVGFFIYLAALSATVQLFSRAMEIALMGTFALASVSAHILTVFTLGPADVGARSSGFPKHMLVLPSSTRCLAGWPMLYGAATSAITWLLIALVVFKPAGLHVPVFWPAALFAAGTAWLQAVGWSPFPSPFARVPALVLALTPLILMGSCAGLHFSSQIVAMCMTFGSIIWILAAYLFAVRGLSRARSGCEGDRLWSSLEQAVARLRDRFAMAKPTRPQFRTAASAQLWHECRRNAIFLPLMLSFVGLPLIVLVILGVLGPDASKSLMFGSQVVSPPMLGLLMLCVAFVLFSGLYGPSLGKFDIWGKEEMPSFFAIRPMATPRFVLVKMISAAISVLAAWGIVLVLISIWALVETSSLNPRESIVRAAIATAGPRDAAIFCGLLLGMPALAWREAANGMWLSLIGRKWLAVSLGILSMIFYSLLVVAGRWVYVNPNVQANLVAYMPWLIAAFAAVKLLAASWVVRELLRHRVAMASTLKIWLGWWIIGCVSLVALLNFLVTPTLIVVAGVFLLLPLTRLAAAPLALHWNRHR